LVGVFVTAIVSVCVGVSAYLNEKEQSLHLYVRLINQSIAKDFVDGTQLSMTEYADIFSRESGYRITFVDPSGTVLGDSKAGTGYVDMENHGDREEIIEAVQTGAGGSDRESKTFGREYLYAAEIGDGDPDRVFVTRIAMEVNKADIIMDQAIKSALLSSLIGIVFAAILALFYSKRLTRPVREMERRLTRTMDENRKAENIRREFVANVTHELKTPLTSIAGFVETIRDDKSIDEKTRDRFLDIISIESARLGRLIDDILIISDIESGRETNTEGDIDVVEAISEVAEVFAPLAKEAGIGILFDYSYEMHMGGNADRFKQMMANLIENAVKYSNADSEIRITAAKESGRIRISVKDEGIGISEEHMGRLFERFFRVDKSRSKAVGGTGLGLAIVKHIAALFDAEIEVKSKPGEGSEFTVVFKA
jgi:two-component system phosphate regulon sensor histidine kinase PhoR